MLYDADCGLCTRFKNLVKLLDVGKRIQPIGMQNRRARLLLADLSEDNYWAGFHVIDAHGSAYHGAAAIPELFRICHPGRLVARLLTAHRWVTGLMSFAYRAFLREHATGACHVPTARR